MMLYTVHFPYETIYVFWFFPLQMRWLMMLYVIFELHPLLLALSGDRLWSGIAHSAHLGGLAFGFLYARYEWRLETILDRMTAFSFRWRRTRHLHLVPGEPAEPNPDPDSVKIDGSGPATIRLTGGPACTLRVSGSTSVSGCKSSQ